jgi:enoyl-CoA hydratase
MTPDPMRLEIRGSVAIIQFNRPAARNALSGETQTRLEEIIYSLIDRTDISKLIFTGTGNVFLSGADIAELSRLDQQEASRFAQRGQRLFEAIADTQQRTVAAINGYCMGGGLDFALACDVRVATPDAAFAHPGARLGIITGWGGTQTLPRLIGKIRAMEFFLTARRLDSREALKIGLIDAIDPSPVHYALQHDKVIAAYRD